MREFLLKLWRVICSFFNKTKEQASIEPINIETNNNLETTVTESIDTTKQEKNSTNMENTKKYNNKVILLDNGHAKSTAGKRSPIFDDTLKEKYGVDQFFEYEFNRDIVKRIAAKLDEMGVKYHILVPEVEEDVKLSTRAGRANEYCNKYGAGNCVFISVHSNAAGNGGWMNGRGWSIYTTKGTTKSDAIATIFYEEANKLLPQYGMTMRKDMTDGDPDYEENFTVIYMANCPAVLTESLFYDNKKDVDFLMSEQGRDVIAQIHVNAIERISFD